MRCSGRRLQSTFSGFDEVLPGRSHWPDLLQHGLCLPGNMKYCSHETQPPHRNVATRTNDSTELATALSTTWCYYATLGRSADVGAGCAILFLSIALPASVRSPIASIGEREHFFRLCQSLRSGGVQTHSGIPFGFLPELAFTVAGPPTGDGSCAPTPK